jgi:protein CrcB
MARYLVAGAVHRFAPPFFPYGTFVVNVTGCAVFGLLAGLANERGMMGVEGRAFLLIGVLGGYTTFSTFGFETFELLRTRKEQAVVVVGHQPNFSAFLSAALGGGHVRLEIEFKKGGAACIGFTKKIEPGQATLRWMLPPRMLRAL